MLQINSTATFTVSASMSLLENGNLCITDLEPDILEREVKWTLESIPMNKVEVMEFW